jgi:hypothetical protein
MLDAWECRRMKRVLEAALANPDEVSDWEFQRCKEWKEVFDALGSMMKFSKAQWEIIFQIADKLGIDLNART